jgi:predicted ribosomally synthesized peptide with nif11-like leader
VSKAEIERFVSDMKTNNKLREELKAAEIDEAGIVGFAKSKGYDISAEEVKSHLGVKMPHLSDEELDKVAGGGATAVSTNVEEAVEVATTEVTVTETTAAQDAEVTTTVAAVAELVAT